MSAAIGVGVCVGGKGLARDREGLRCDKVVQRAPSGREAYEGLVEFVWMDQGRRDAAGGEPVENKLRLWTVFAASVPNQVEIVVDSPAGPFDRGPGPRAPDDAGRGGPGHWTRAP